MLKEFFLLSTLLCLSGCVYTPIVNYTDLSKVNFNELQTQKMGSACDTVILFAIPIERYASVARAAFSAGIKHVSYVEEYSANLYPLFYKRCVLVYGD